MEPGATKKLYSTIQSKYVKLAGAVMYSYEIFLTTKKMVKHTKSVKSNMNKMVHETKLFSKKNLLFDAQIMKFITSLCPRFHTHISRIFPFP